MSSTLLQRLIRRETLLALGLAGMFGLLLAAYVWGKRSTPATAPAGPLEKLIIATNTEYIGACPVIAARDRGYFAAQGIQAQVQSHSSGKASLNAVLQGRADFATVADLALALAILNEQPISIVTTIFRTEKDHGIVGRKDHAVLSPASLKGKRIGVTLGTSGHFTLDVFLNRQRLRSSEVTMVNYRPEELGAALDKGEVDAIAGWEPFLKQNAASQGGNAVTFYGNEVYESIYNIAGMRAFVTEHPRTVTRLLRALAEGARFCSDQVAEASRLVAPAVKTSEAELRAAWPAYRFGIDLDQGLILALEDESRWAIKNKFSNRSDIPNYLDHIYLDGMVEVKPGNVSIIH
ncbi:ABC transporter substrate-binding protein [Massilia sp. YIM B04103]|uniref:ABC transporter substrate-binding protein n=1 Tax=Massilia sp. YIM B04103 TaxID=2963106 RepID=UPI00210A8807|nr:NrtA/SsuA/CpmA family ABC transporter substrate-binding protein [Massilia sp. YIM B04103]